MLFNSLILLLLSNSITSRRDKSILYSRTAITILTITAFIAYDNFLFFKGIGLFAGLFHNTATTYSLHIFITLVIILTNVILLSLHVRNHMKNLPITFLPYPISALRNRFSFFLEKSIIYLSSKINKYTNKFVKIKIHLSIFLTLAFFIFIIYGAIINKEKYFISDSLTSTLMFIGLCMLILDLTLDNKSNLPIKSKIKLLS